MRPSRTILSLLIFTAVALLPLSAQQPSPLTIDTDSLPSAVAGSVYRCVLKAHGGTPPYQWRLANGNLLPPGLHLNASAGTISGTPQKAGEYHFTLELHDAAGAAVQREYTIAVIAALTIDWKRPPKVSGTWLAGSVIVANHTGDPVDLTVVIVGVNQIGRATALGYQHFELSAGAEQEIPFGASPGPGSYFVRADAVAQTATGKRRASKQTPPDHPLVVGQV